MKKTGNTPSATLHHPVRQLLLHLAAIALALGAHTLAQPVFESLEKKWNAPVNFRFRLPLPAEIIRRYGIKGGFAVERVTITGPFSNWIADNPPYRMTRISATEWAITLTLAPGDNLYKFVVHAGQPFFDSQDQEWRRQIWVHDPGATLVPDNFGGFNSVHKVRTIRPFAFVFNIIMLGIAGLFAVLLVLKLLIGWIANRPLSFRTKLVLSALLIVLVANLALGWYNFRRQAAVTREGYIDTLNVLHTHLVRSGIDFADPGAPATRTAFARELRALLDLTVVRQEAGIHRNQQFNIEAVLLLSTNLEPLALAQRQTVYQRDERLALQAGYSNAGQFFRHGVLGKFIAALPSPLPAEAHFGRLDQRLAPPGKSFSGNGTPLLGYDTLLYPILVTGRLTGWYAVTIHTELLGSILRESLLFNAALMLVVILIVSILLSRMGTMLTANINALIRGIEWVKEGNLDHELTLSTRDEFQKLAEAYNFMRSGLKETDRLKEEFLSNTSHELRTPLNAIIGIAELSEEGAYGAPGPELARALKTISENAHNLNSLVSGLLEYARIKRGELELTRESFNLQDLVAEVLELSRGLLRHKELTLDSRFAEALPAVLADRSRTRQILINLVGNAVKFTNRGSVLITARPENGMLAVTVTDTGIGIREADIPKLFQEFRQLDGSVSREAGGTGLGLAITRRLVELQGGEIRVKSTPGEGSAFTFTLPLTGAAATDAGDTTLLLEAPAPERGTVPPGAGETILVIDADPAGSEVLRSRLQSGNYRVLTAASAAEALSLLPQEEVALILCDTQALDCSGPEFCSRLKSAPATAALPVIMISARTGVTDKLSALQAGAADFIAKPVMRRELLAKIRQLLDEQQGTQPWSSESERRRAAYTNIRPGKGEKILVIDDEPVNLEILKGRLEMQGYRVLTAADGLAGLELTRSEKPDLILLDLMMPRLSGFEFCEIVKSDETLRAIPVIILTARNSTEDRVYGISLGADDYISKPFDKVELLVRIRFHLDHTRSIRELQNLKDHLESEVQKRTADLQAAQTALLDAFNENNDLAVTDGLTRIYNRPWFSKIYEGEVARSIREQQPLSLLVLDLDHFKRVNDSYGHQAGDSCLKAVAAFIKSTLNRSTDRVARYGGEEFAVLLVNTDRTGAMEIAERIRAGIETLPITHEGTTINMTVSIGVFSGRIPRDVRSHLPLTLADEALYKAKEEGRNRVVLAQPLEEPETEKRRSAQPPSGRRKNGKGKTD